MNTLKGDYTVYTLWQGEVSIIPYVSNRGMHGVSREDARRFAAWLNKHYGRESHHGGKHLAGPISSAPPIEAFE
jgi:hypothetical protein